MFGRGSKTPPKSGAPPARGKPLHLLRFDEGSKKFTLGEEALDCLRAVKGPVGVLAVCGRARQGKSFILNQLAGAAASNDAGFKVGPTVKPCTKGLWIWSAPIPTRTPAGEPYHLILLDTEGIDAYDQTGQYSTQIFSMAVLLSSLFVYNQMGGIDEAALDRLSLVTEMTKHIRVRAEEGANGKPRAASAAELGRFSPSFVWLLRDFYLDLADSDDNGGPSRAISPAEYLESALRSVDDRGPGAVAKNAIRDSIKALFPERECFPLVRPVNDEAQLRNLDALSADQFRPEFKDGLNKLVTTLFARCGPKRIGDDVLTGAALAGVAEAYADALNRGAVPVIATAWQSVAEAECRKALDKALLEYDKAFADFASSDDARFVDEDSSDDSATRLHEAARNAALDVFRRDALGAVGSEPRQNAQNAMDAELTRRRKVFVEKRRAERAAACASRLAEAGTRLRAVADAADADPDDVVAAADAEASAVAADSGLGPGRHALLVSWMRDVALSSARGVANRVKARLERELAQAEERAARDAADARGAAARAEKAELNASEQARRAADLSARVVDAEKASAEAHARARETEAHASSARSVSELELNSLKRDAQAMERECASLRAALEQEKKRASEAAEKRAAAETELAAARRDGASARAKVSDEVQRAESETHTLREKLREAEREKEAALSLKRNAEATASASAAEARATAAGAVAAAEAAAADAVRRAAECERRAKVAEGELERMREAATARRRSMDGRRNSVGAGGDAGGDAAAAADDAAEPVDDTFARWREEAEAAAAAAAGPEAAAAALGSPGKRRRRDEAATAAANDSGGAAASVEEVANAAGAGETSDASARETAASMTVAQLKHELQVLGLAHLYVGKRGVKKADLVEMFVNRGES